MSSLSGHGIALSLGDDGVPFLACFFSFLFFSLVDNQALLIGNLVPVPVLNESSYIPVLPC